jgi:hypothetical protein
LRPRGFAEGGKASWRSRPTKTERKARTGRLKRFVRARSRKLLFAELLGAVVFDGCWVHWPALLMRTLETTMGLTFFSSMAII